MRGMTHTAGLLPELRQPGDAAWSVHINVQVLRTGILWELCISTIQACTGTTQRDYTGSVQVLCQALQGGIFNIKDLELPYVYLHH